MGDENTLMVHLASRNDMGNLEGSRVTIIHRDECFSEHIIYK